jgi:hypothetical protein
MKPLRDDNEFNSPREMLIRATFLLCLATFPGGILITLAGAATHDPRLLAVGILLLMTAALLRAWLRGQGRFEAADAALHEITQTGTPPDFARVAELVRLLREWEALERHRGSPGFDPWALQAIRHDIRVMVEEDPALEGLFRDHRDAA